MKKRLFAVLLIVVTICSIFCACGSKNKDADFNTNIIYYYKLAGNKYDFPSALSNYLDNGWELQGNTSGEDVSASDSLKYGKNMIVYITKDNLKAEAVCSNINATQTTSADDESKNSTDDISLGDATITDLTVINSSDTKAFNFSFFDGRINGNSTVNQLKAVFKNQNFNYTVDDSNYNFSTFKVQLSNASLVFQFENGKINRVNFTLF